MGDPGGIGAEVIVKSLADRALRAQAYFRILGTHAAIDAAARRAGIQPFWQTRTDTADVARAEDVVLIDGEPGGIEHAAAPTRSGGELSFRFVQDAIALALLPADHPLHADAIVTGPINKAAWAQAGHTRFPGHTELLAERCNVERFGMMFHVPSNSPSQKEEAGGGLDGHPNSPVASTLHHTLNVILASAHVPLMSVKDVLTIERVGQTIALGHQACKDLGIRSPRVAVCGLNPHAGEGGILGDDDERVIEPAIRIARQNGIDASGPHPGDTIFIAALQGTYDLVVAMYHDQGLIPVKLLARDRAVNMTVGLPIIRTSPDHGTAFDIAGKNIADPGSMRSAIELAVRLARVRRSDASPTP